MKNYLHAWSYSKSLIYNRIYSLHCEYTWNTAGIATPSSFSFKIISIELHESALQLQLSLSSHVCCWLDLFLSLTFGRECQRRKAVYSNARLKLKLHGCLVYPAMHGSAKKARLYGGPTMAKGDQLWRHRWSGRTSCGAANGPGGPATAAVIGPGDRFWGDQL